MELNPSEYVRAKELQKLFGISQSFIDKTLGKLPPPAVLKLSYRLKLYNLELCKLALIDPESLSRAMADYQRKLLPKGKKK